MQAFFAIFSDKFAPKMTEKRADWKRLPKKVSTIASKRRRAVRRVMISGTP
jgi:hypothetical protein